MQPGLDLYFGKTIRSQWVDDGKERLFLQEYRRGTVVSCVLAVEMETEGGFIADSGYFIGIISRNL